MKYLHTVIFAVCAVVLFFGAMAENSELLGLLSFAFGGGALGTLLPTFRPRLRDPLPGPELERRLREVEERLRFTEDDLAAASRDIDRLKIAAEFDRELRQSGSPRLRSPGE